MALLDLANETISDLAILDTSVYLAFSSIGGIVADITPREIHG